MVDTGSVVSAHEEQLADHQYRNWVKAGLGLKYLKEGAEGFVDTCLKHQQTDLLQAIGNELLLSSVQCGQCSLQNLLPHKFRSCGRGRVCHCFNQQSRRECPKRVCGKLYERVVHQHRYGTPSWQNTDLPKWFTDHWEIGKCFLDKKGYKDKTSANDMDCKALLNLIINNMYIHTYIDEPIDPPNDIFSKNKRARNDILHSGTLKLTDAQLKAYVDGMIEALMDEKTLKQDLNAVKAVQKLTLLKSDKFIITSRDEIQIREDALSCIEDAKNDAITHLEEKQSELMSDMEVDSLKEEVQTLKDSVSELKETQDKSKENAQSISGLTNKQVEFDTRLQSIEQTVVLEQSQSSRLSAVERRQATIENMVSDLKQAQVDTSVKLRELQADIADLKKKVDEQNALKAAHEKRLLYLKRKEGLQKLLIKLYEDHLSTIPVSPILEEIDASLKDIYVDLTITDDLVHDPGQKVTTAPRHVKNYSDIILKNGKRCKNIYMLGVAGIGKTTWCLNVLRTWVSAFTTDSSHSEGKNKVEMEDELFLKANFDVILYVALRHAASDGNICDMILHQLFDEYPDMYEVALEIIKTESEKILVICDGLDEWSPPADYKPASNMQNIATPGRRSLYGASVITTTRPWKLDKVRLKEKEIDRSVKLEGVKGQSRFKKLVNSILDHLNKKVKRDHVKDTSEERFIKDVRTFFPKRNSLDFSFSSLFDIPLLLVFVVCRWHESGELDKTLAANYTHLLEFLLKRAEDKVDGKIKGRLSSVENMEELKQLWMKHSEEDFNGLPECIKENQLCMVYSHLIRKLSKFAFESLFISTESARIVFTQDELKNWLTYDELHVCVKVGILTQSKVIGKSLTKMSNLSFLHKSFQEFFAALHVTQKCDTERASPLEIFKTHIQSSSDVKKMEMLLRMVCGMDSNVARKITVYIDSLVNFQWRMHHLDTLISCVREINMSSAEIIASCPIFTSVIEFQWLPHESAEMRALISMNKRHLKTFQGRRPLSVNHQTLTEYMPFQNDLLYNLADAIHLESLNQTLLYISDQNAMLFSKPFHNFRHLRSLTLFDVLVHKANPSQTVVCLDLTSCTCLVHVWCKNIKAVNTIIIDSPVLEIVDFSRICPEEKAGTSEDHNSTSCSLNSGIEAVVYIDICLKTKLRLLSITDSKNCIVCVRNKDGVRCTGIKRLTCVNLTGCEIDLCDGTAVEKYRFRVCNSCYVGNFRIHKHVHMDVHRRSSVDSHALVTMTSCPDNYLKFRNLTRLFVSTQALTEHLCTNIRSAYRSLKLVQLYGTISDEHSKQQFKQFLSVLPEQSCLKHVSCKIMSDPDSLRVLALTIAKLKSLETLTLYADHNTVERLPLFNFDVKRCSLCIDESDEDTACKKFVEVEELVKSKLYISVQYDIIDALSTLTGLVSLTCAYLPTHTLHKLDNLQTLICKDWTHMDYKGLKESLHGLKRLSTLVIVDEDELVCLSLLENLFELKNLKRYEHIGFRYRQGKGLEKSLPKTRVEILKLRNGYEYADECCLLNLTDVKTLKTIFIDQPKLDEDTWERLESNLPTPNHNFTIELTAAFFYGSADQCIGTIKSSLKFPYQAWRNLYESDNNITLSNMDILEN